MRSKFRGHFSETQETIDELWQSATFVFDANVLLNLYRYSDKTRTEFVRIIRGVKDRVWVPEQCVFEYFSNRLRAISEQERAYKSTIEELTKIEERFSASNKHPFISEESHSELSKVLSKISKELEKSRKNQEIRFDRDDIKNTLADVLDGCVGDAFSSDAMQDVFKEGESRYAESVPPGYKDKDKVKDPKTDSDKRRIFGDLILWKQTIAQAKDAEVDIIFVTDDSKEDWWQKHGNRTIAPRPELIEEFCGQTQRKIMIYSPDRFIEFAEKQLGSKVSAGTLDEVKAEYSKHLNEEVLEAALNAWKQLQKNNPGILGAAAQAKLQADQLTKTKAFKDLVFSRSELQTEIKRVEEKLEVLKLIGDDSDQEQIELYLRAHEELNLSLAVCERQILELKQNAINAGVFE